MARLPRAVVPDTPHHITQRGNGKQNVFANDRDREVYLKAFFDYASRYSLRVCGGEMGEMEGEMGEMGTGKWGQ